MLGAKAAPAEAALRKRLDDPSGAVQVAIAEALAGLGQTEAALPVLERALKNTNALFFALQAANVLDRLGERARPLLPTIKQRLASQPTSADASGPRAYLERIMNRIVTVLEGRGQPLVYPATRQESSTVNHHAGQPR